MRIRREIIIGSIMLAILLLEASQALGYGSTRIVALDRGIEMISGVFNIQSLQDNSLVQEGFLKFMIFIVLFAVSHFGLKRANLFDNKTSGIVSFAFSMIGVFMMPIAWLMATGGAITAIMSSFVFLLVFVGGGLVAIFVLRPKEDRDNLGWVKNMLGLMLLFFLLFLIEVWALFTRMPLEGSGFGRGSVLLSIYSVMVSWTYILLVILIIAKIFMWISGGLAGRRAEGGRDDEDDDRRDDGRDGRDNPPQQPPPPQLRPPPPPPAPVDFTGRLDELENLLNSHQQASEVLRRIGNEVLQTNYDHNRGGGYSGPANPPVSAEQLNALIESVHRRLSLEQRINELITSISNDANLPRAPEEQRNRCVQLSDRRITQIAAAQTFYNEFIRRFNNAEPPIP